MGIFEAPEKCYITDMPTENIPSEIDSVDYGVLFNNKEFFFTFDRGYEMSDFVRENIQLLRGLLLNDRFPLSKGSPTYLNNKILEKIIQDDQKH